MTIKQLYEDFVEAVELMESEDAPEWIENVDWDTQVKVAMTMMEIAAKERRVKPVPSLRTPRSKYRR